MTILTKQEAFAKLSEGATVITGSLRLARTLEDDYGAAQSRAGRDVWPTPDVVAWPAWLQRAWAQLSDVVFDRGEFAPLLLNGDQDRVVWEGVIAANPPEGAPLLDAVAVSRDVRKSWALLHDWKPAIEATEWEGTRDCEYFRQWQIRYRTELRRNNWIDESILPDLLLSNSPSAWLSATEIILAGFDEFTPRQEQLIAHVADAGLRVFTLHTNINAEDGAQWRLSCPDTAGEIRAAAAWTSDLLSRKVRGPIGVVARDLRRQRRRIEQTFTEILHPESVGDPEAQRAFNISLGRPFSDYPVIASALNALDLARDRVPVDVISGVLRSPFFRGADAEFSRRALIDAELRRLGAFELTLDRVITSARGCAVLHRALRHVQRSCPSLPFTSSPAEWARFFSDLLTALGWPGDRTRNSAEFQALGHWQELLSRFARLDVVTGSVSMDEARTRLRRMAAEDVWQPKSGAAPVQILGLFETSGLVFEHLWIMGLHDEDWPQPPSPDPFIPLAAQRRHNMPGATNARELDFAARETARLRRSGREIIFSCPSHEGDRELRPSRLLASVPESEPRGEIIRPAALMYSAAPALEATEDDRAPRLQPGMQKGGTSLFKDFSACAFRAVAKHRLRARPLVPARVGLDPSERGSLAHRCLARLWQSLQTSRALESQPRVTTAIRTAVTTVLTEAAAEFPAISPRLRDLEQQRLESLLVSWIALERQRAPFHVIATEQKSHININGLELDVKADRVDEVEGFGRMIVDYKTGIVGRKPWEGDRPAEPQLPLYACTADQPPAGIAFALLKAGKLAYQGVATQRDLFPKAAVVDDWDQMLGTWRGVLEQLATGILSGDARVAPNRGACDECDASPLCRIKEAPRAARS